MGAAPWLLAVVGWLVVGMVPGFLVATALAPAAAAVARWAVSPLVALAIAYASATWIDLVHRGWGVAAAAAGLALAVVASLVVVVRRDGLAALRPGPWTRGRGALLAVVAVSLGLGLTSVATSRHGFGSVVPFDDGVSHGVFTARILLSGSVDPLHVAVTDVASSSEGVFYPLALHTVAALLAHVTGTQAAIAAVGVVAATVWAPLAIAAWGRRLVGTAPAVVAAAVLGIASPWFPTAQLQWGGWTLVAAVALVPAAALVLLDARRAGGIALAALAIGGLLGLHVSEVLVVLLMWGLTWALDAGTRRRPGARVRDVVAATALGALVLVPSAPALASRAVGAPADVFGFGPDEALVELLAHPVVGVSLGQQLAVGTALLVVAWWVLVVAGSRAMWRTATARGTVAAVWAFVAASFVGLLGIAPQLTVPWYSNGYRLLAQAAALAALPIAAAVVGIAQRTGAERAVGLSVCGAALVGLAASGVATASTAWQSSVLSAQERAAFAWLAARVAPGERVLNDPRDGTGWVYAATDGAVAPLFSVHPDGWRSSPTWTERWYLHDHAADDDPRVDALLRTWRIRYAVVGSEVFPRTGSRLTIDALRTSNRWREAYCQGSACVFERVPRPAPG